MSTVQIPDITKVDERLKPKECIEDMIRYENELNKHTEETKKHQDYLISQLYPTHTVKGKIMKNNEPKIEEINPIPKTLKGLVFVCEDYHVWQSEIGTIWLQMPVCPECGKPATSWKGYFYDDSKTGCDNCRHDRGDLDEHNICGKCRGIYDKGGVE